MTHRKTIPSVKDDQLLQRFGEEVILLFENRTGKIRPTLARIGTEWKRLLTDRHMGSYNGLQTTSPPTNIKAEYRGAAGSSCLIEPKGQYDITSATIPGCVIRKLQTNEVMSSLGILTFPSVVGVRESYGIYAVGAAPSIIVEFDLVADRDTMEEGFLSASPLTTNSPNILYPDQSGAMRFTYTTINDYYGDGLQLEIHETENITITPQRSIVSGDTVSYRVDGDPTGDAVIHYAYYNSHGYYSPAYSVTLPVEYNTVEEDLGVWIDSFPGMVTANSVFDWYYGGASNGTTVRLLNLVNLSTPVTTDIEPGVPVPITVLGDAGEVATFSYMVLYLGNPRGVYTRTAIIDPIGPDLSGLTISESSDHVNPCSFYAITFSNVPEADRVTVTASDNRVIMTPSYGPVGTTFTVYADCEIDPTIPINLVAVFDSATGTSVHVHPLPVEAASGTETVSVSRIFYKPGGVTSITVTSRGGVGEDTLLTGAVTHVFEGDVTEPPITSITFNGLDPAEDTISVILATDATARFTWS